MNEDNDKNIVLSDRDKWINALSSQSSFLSTLSEEEKKEVEKSYNKLKNGFFSNVPMICQGTECFARHSCPFFKINKMPVGEQCAVEYDLLNYHISKYATEYNLDPYNNHSELILLTELAECIIYEDRATKMLALPDGNQMILAQLRFTKDGDPYEEKSLHPALVVKDKMKERRLKILKELLGTRKEKSKVNKGNIKEDHYGNKFGDVKAKLEELSKKILAETPIIEEAKFEVVSEKENH